MNENIEASQITRKIARKGEYGQGSVNSRKWDNKWIARVRLDGERLTLGVYDAEDEGWRVVSAFWDEYTRSNISNGKGPLFGAFGVECIEERANAGTVLDSRNERSRWRTYVIGGEFTFGKKMLIKYNVPRDPIAALRVTELRPIHFRQWLVRQRHDKSDYPFTRTRVRSTETLRHALQVARTVLISQLKKRSSRSIQLRTLRSPRISVLVANRLELAGVAPGRFTPRTSSEHFGAVCWFHDGCACVT